MSIPSLSDISSMQGIKRTAYAFKSKSSPHAALGMVIYELKVYHEELLKFINARTNVMSAILKWITEEEDFALKDVFNRMAELEWMWSKVMHEVAVENVDYRKTFKNLLAEEKSLDEYRKTYAAAEGKVEKVKKQVDSFKGSKSKKTDKAKSEALDAELAAVLGREEEAGAALDRKTRQTDLQKASSIREAVETHVKCQLSVSEKMIEINKAECALVELLPSVPTQLTKDKIYTGLKESERIVQDVTDKLGMGKPPCCISDPGYSPVYQPWSQQPTDPPVTPPTAMFYTPPPGQDDPQLSHYDFVEQAGQMNTGAASRGPPNTAVSTRFSYSPSSDQQQPPEPPPRPVSLNSVGMSKTPRKPTDELPNPREYMEIVPGSHLSVPENRPRSTSDSALEDTYGGNYQELYEELSIYDNAGAPSRQQPVKQTQGSTKS